jgi:phosphate transport system substrate-binding protein
MIVQLVASIMFFQLCFFSALSAAEITLKLRDGTLEIKGELIASDETSFVIKSARYGVMALESAKFECVGTGCPKFAVDPTAVTGAISAGPTRLGIHGSNTIGAQLMPALVEHYAASKGLAVERVIGAQPEQVELRLREKGGRPEIIELHSYGTGTGIPGLAQAKAQLAMLSRPITDEETKLMAASKQTAQPHVIALDGLVVFVSRNNPIQSLTLDQISRVFAGEIKDWSELGRNPGKINVYARDDKSGTYDTFNALVLRPFKRVISPQAKRFESSPELSDETARDPNGIGFAGFAYLRNAKALAIGSECGIVLPPSEFLVKTEDYPLARRLFVYTSSAARVPLADNILQHALSEKAQNAVTQAGFINQIIEARSFEDQASRLASALLAPDADFNLPLMRQLVADIRDARRLSSTIRFERNSAALDTRAQQEIPRLARLLTGPTWANKQIMLLGFGDSQGPFEGNRIVAYNRALAVREALIAAGVSPTASKIIVRGYGELMPVGCNTTDAGREKNRRVEVWVKG